MATWKPIQIRMQPRPSGPRRPSRDEQRRAEEEAREAEEDRARRDREDEEDRIEIARLAWDGTSLVEWEAMVKADIAKDLAAARALEAAKVAAEAVKDRRKKKAAGAGGLLDPAGIGGT